jgi:hypothetical protein
MSVDAGGLAQMTYQTPFNGNNSIGVSGPGFATRGKAPHIKRLSVAPPSNISTIDEAHQAGSVATPRTARGHLLAGLRTAPKSATVAPATGGLEHSRYADHNYDGASRVPQTTTSAYFPQGRKMSAGGNRNSSYQDYSYQEQVLAPPQLDFGNQGLDGIDPDEYEQLMATNRYLAHQQRQLQQQLAEITSAAQQFGHLNINTGLAGQQYQSPVSNSPMSMYTQQLQQGLQPIVQPVPGNPGIYSVYNPMTGQSTFVYDNAHQQQQQQQQPMAADKYGVTSPQTAPVFQRQTSDPIVPRSQMRSVSPPKPTPSPQTDVEPLPPPSANAFRRGHRKNMSSANIKTTGDWARPAGPRSAGVPPTPATGTFGPGHGRAGEHPVRQPKGPPLLQELEEKPTAKHEGSKNFATRQRRRAVHDLVKAGRERRSDVRQPGSGSGTPASENEFNFSASGSDSDSVLAGSTSLTSRPSISSLGVGAIGSERKEKSRDRSSVDSNKSYSGDEKMMLEMEAARRSTPLLVLSNAEKRRSVVM